MTILSLLSLLLPAGYALVAILAWLEIKGRRLFTARSAVFYATLVLHTTYIYIYTRAAGHCLLTDPYELLSMMAFALALVTALGTLSVASVSFVTTSIIFVAQLASSLVLGGSTLARPAYWQPAIDVHVSFIIVGYTALTLAVMYGALYLALYGAIKRGRFAPIVNVLPDLESLERLTTRASAVSFFSLTVAIVVGYVWLPRIIEHFSWFDAKLLSTLAMWILLGGALAAKVVARREGKRIVTLLLWSFFLAALSTAVIHFFIPSFHNF